MGWKGFALLWISYCAISNLLTGLQGLLNFFLPDLFLVLVLVISHVVSHSGILEFYHIFVHMKTSGWLYKTLWNHTCFFRGSAPQLSVQWNTGWMCSATSVHQPLLASPDQPTACAIALMPQLMDLTLAFLIVPSHALFHNASEFRTKFARVPLHGKNFQSKLLFDEESWRCGKKWGFFFNKSFAGVELNIAELELCDISLQETFDFCTLLLGCLFK